MNLAQIPEVLTAFAEGRAVVVQDDPDREDEGDIIFAAQFATEELLAFTIRHTSGVLCVPMSPTVADRLALPPMVSNNQDPKGTAYTVSCDALAVSSTGISAADRATTARTMAAPATTPQDLTRPGHMFGLRAEPGGVLHRAGHTEAAVDLAMLAGLQPVAVIAELVNDDGTMMRGPQLADFAAHHGLLHTSIAQLAEFRSALNSNTAQGVRA